MPPTPNFAPQLLTSGQAAQLLSVSQRTVQAWIADERIPYITLPSGQHRIPQQALLASLGGNYRLTETDLHDARVADQDVVQERVAGLERDLESASGRA